MKMYKPGTVVKVRSGGPRMAVISRNGDTHLCEYYSKRAGQYLNGQFNGVALRRAGYRFLFLREGLRTLLLLALTHGIFLVSQWYK